MHDPHFIGCIQVDPPLNDDEVGFLLALSQSGRTLRSTPTGRGNSDVPFARLGWEVCATGCCLSWSGGREATRWMQPSLSFLIDHVFRDGAEGEDRQQFEAFTFDHVLNGIVVGQRESEVDVTLVEVTDNAVTGRLIPAPCPAAPAHAAPAHAAPPKRPRTPPRERAGPPPERAGPHPPNVIELRPRRAR